MSEKQVIRFSASAAPRSNCLLRLKRTIIGGYQEALPYNDTQYGSAVHKFISTMHETKGNFTLATMEAKRIFQQPCQIRDGKKHLTEIHMLKTCVDYWEHFESKDDADVLLDSDGKPLVEVSFSNTVYSGSFLEIRFEGVMDKIVKIKNGCYAVGDYKITSAWNSEGFLDNFRLSHQLRFYRWNILEAAKLFPDSALATIAKHPIGYFVDGIFISKDGAKFQRSEVIIPSAEEDREYEESLDRIIDKLRMLHENPDYQTRDGIAIGACIDMKYPCEFIPVCCAPDAIARAHVLRNNFIVKPYEPLKHSKD